MNNETKRDLTSFECILINPSDCDPRLHYASLAGFGEAIESLLENEPEMRSLLNHQISPIGATPLRLAATEGHLDVVSLLLDYGVPVDTTDFKQQTPLYMAIKNNHLGCARLLLQNGANPNGSDGNRCTPLYWAAQYGYIKQIMLLMEYGAETEITSRLLGNELQSYEGLLSDLLHHFHTRNVDYSFNPLTHAVVKTSLYITVVYDHLDCFTALLAAGAQPDLRLLQLPENIIRELSLIHVVISHNANERYVHLFALFGGYLWQRDTLGRLAIDLPVPAASKAALLCYMETPLPLLSQCRIVIRRSIGRHRLSLLRTLNLPSQLLDYLHYKDIINLDLLVYT